MTLCLYKDRMWLALLVV